MDHDTTHVDTTRALCDSSGRRISYLRLSITDRCNLRCSYCMPKEGVGRNEREDLLSFEEFTFLIKALVPRGISKIRITGGEPLVRKGIVEFLSRVKTVAPSVLLCMTSNGVLLSKYLKELRKAGLDRVNVSLDTLHREKFRTLTGFDHLSDVLTGIDMLIEAGMFPVKLNVLLIPGFNEEEIDDFIELARTRPVELRFIEKMPIGHNADGSYRSLRGVADYLETKFGRMWSERGNGETARLFTISGFAGKIGLVSPLSEPFCSDCNRLRITAHGTIINCLLGGFEYDLKTALRDGDPELDVSSILLRALSEKPPGYDYRRLFKGRPLKKCMVNIGG